MGGGREGGSLPGTTTSYGDEDDTDRVVFLEPSNGFFPLFSGMFAVYPCV